MRTCFRFSFFLSVVMLFFAFFSIFHPRSSFCLLSFFFSCSFVFSLSFLPSFSIPWSSSYLLSLSCFLFLFFLPLPSTLFPSFYLLSFSLFLHSIPLFLCPVLHFLHFTDKLAVFFCVYMFVILFSHSCASFVLILVVCCVVLGFTGLTMQFSSLSCFALDFSVFVLLLLNLSLCITSLHCFRPFVLVPLSSFHCHALCFTLVESVCPSFVSLTVLVVLFLVTCYFLT